MRPIRGAQCEPIYLGRPRLPFGSHRPGISLGCTVFLATVTPDGQQAHELVTFYLKLGFTDDGRKVLSASPKSSGSRGSWVTWLASSRSFIQSGIELIDSAHRRCGVLHDVHLLTRATVAVS